MLMLLLIILITSVFVFVISYAGYRSSYLTNYTAVQQLPTWETAIYYIIVAYPIVAIFFAPMIDVYLLSDHVIDMKYKMKGVIWFCTGHTVIGMLAIVISQYLATRKKLNWLFVIINTIVAACFIVAILSVIW
ncbi:MAG: hypothetical protein KDC11_08385 [Chitinophagaceae bacterium]|nr:hypothetical protein [Chitinophagaceae bacterium]